MKKIMTLLLTAVLALSCCGVTVFAEESWYPGYESAEQFALARVSYFAESVADFPLYGALEQDGDLIYIYAEPNEEIVLSGLQAEFERCGIGECDPKNYVQCVDLIRFSYTIKGYLDNYVIGTHKTQPHHIYIDVEDGIVKIHYDSGTNESEIIAVRDCIAEQYFDESIIKFCSENLITDLNAICELLQQFTEDQNFDDDMEVSIGVSANGFSAAVCFEYAQDAEDAKPLYDAYMKANSIDRSKVFISGILEGSSETAVRLRGDINNDVKVNAYDAQLVLCNALDLMLGNETEPLAGADIDGDSAVTSLDAQYILKFYLENTIMEEPTMWKDIIQ